MLVKNYLKKKLKTSTSGLSTRPTQTFIKNYAQLFSFSGATLAPSSMSGSYTTSKTRSSLKRSPTKKYAPSGPAKDPNYPGYNKLRLDSAISPKHSPRSSAAGVEKVREAF